MEEYLPYSQQDFPEEAAQDLPEEVQIALSDPLSNLEEQIYRASWKSVGRKDPLPEESEFLR